MDTILSDMSIASIKAFINWICHPAPFFVLSCVGLTFFLLRYRFFTRPAAALLVGGVFAVFYILSAFDPNFFQIIAKPDNVPISMMIILVGFFTWLGFRRAAINDDRLERGESLLEAGAEDKVLVWPDLVYIELIALTLCTVFLVVWAMVLRAPLEQPADPNLAPNPAKAPWYFLGLQELLVYFDPWIAGVLLPGLIIVGLSALPYLDRNPRGNGYYTFKERRFVIWVFMFGWLILWLLLIIFGTFLRGPNWNFFGPYEHWDPHRPAALLNVDFRDIFWARLLNRGIPEVWWIREGPGIVLVLAYFFVSPVVLRATVFRRIYAQMGLVRYSVMIMLLLWMFLVPIKMALRWTLNLHYIVAITEYGFNI